MRGGLLDEFDGGNGLLVGMDEGKTHARERLEGRQDDDDDSVEGEGRGWNGWWRLDRGR